MSLRAAKEEQQRMAHLSQQILVQIVLHGRRVPKENV